MVMMRDPLGRPPEKVPGPPPILGGGGPPAGFRRPEPTPRGQRTDMSGFLQRPGRPWWEDETQGTAQSRMDARNDAAAAAWYKPYRDLMAERDDAYRQGGYAMQRWQERMAALQAMYPERWGAWASGKSYMDWVRDRAGGGRSPHSGFPDQSGGTPYIRPDTGASQANMIQAMKAQQMRDSAAANRDEQFRRQQWEQLMQMMQMLIGGGGNQITPPSMGGFNSGQYNMRPPAGEIL